MTVRALVVLEQVRLSGLVRQVVELATRLPDHDCHPLIVLVTREEQDAHPVRSELGRRGIPCEVIRERAPFDPSPVRRLHEIIEAWDPQILETHGYKSAVYALLLGAGRGQHLAWLAFYHGHTSTNLRVRAYHVLERWAMRFATAIAAVAPGVESHFRRSDRERVTVVPNGVVELGGPHRSREEARRWLGVEEKGPLVGFVGRLSHEKGPDNFVRTLAQLTPGGERGRRPQGVIVGEGPMRAEVEALIRAEGMNDSVRCTGRKDDVCDVYQAIDALLISSRSELFPNVLLEAVAARVPVAAAPVGGIPDIARGLASVVVASDDRPKSLSRAVAEALELRGKAVVSSSRRRLLEDFSQDRRAAILAELYGRLAAKTQ